MARIMAEKLPSIIGQPVIVENRPSVGAIVGTSYVAKAKPDGYTLLMGAPGPIIFNHAVYAKLPLHPQELTPISFVSDSPLILIVNANSPAKNVQGWLRSQSKTPTSPTTAQARHPSSSSPSCSRKTGGQFTHIPALRANDAVTAIDGWRHHHGPG